MYTYMYMYMCICIHTHTYAAAAAGAPVLVDLRPPRDGLQLDLEVAPVAFLLSLNKFYNSYKCIINLNKS